MITREYSTVLSLFPLLYTTTSYSLACIAKMVAKDCRLGMIAVAMLRGMSGPMTFFLLFACSFLS